MKTSMPVLFAVLALQGFNAAAQDDTDYLSGVEDLLNEDVKLEAGKFLAEVISDRSKYLDISYVDPGDSSDNSGWNVRYDLKYAHVADDGFSTRNGVARLSTLEAKLDIVGNYSYNNTVTNDDLSSAKASFAYVYGNFGDVPVVSRTGSLAYQKCLEKLTLPLDDGDISDEELKQARTAYAEDSVRCEAKAGIQQLFENVRNQAAYAYELGFHAGIEGNQNYSESQDVYGGTAIFSATRWPSLRVNLERVDASSNEQRTMLTNDDTYDRFTLELGYQYSITAVKNLPITFALGYRRFHEISAPPEIKGADMDGFDHWSVSLRVPAHMFSFIENKDYSLFVRYTDGQLPFDLDSDSAFELGFSSNIALLGKLFQ